MKDIVLQPTFYDTFQCIGGKCKNNCCCGWRITFSKEEFKNVKRKAKSEDFKKLYEDAFIVYKQDAMPYHIKLDENNRCKFLTEEGLCAMYTEVGPENMSAICQNFPRSCIKYLDKYESFLSIGCEEVIRLLLKEKKGIMLEVKEKKLPKVLKGVGGEISHFRIQKRPMYGYFNEIKMLLLTVLQNRAYKFGERMVLLGMAMQKINAMEEEHRENEIPSYIEHFIQSMDKEENKKIYSDFFNGIEKNGRERAVQSLFRYQGLFAINTNQIKDIKEKIEKRLKINRKVSIIPGGESILSNSDVRFNVEYSKEEYEKAMQSFENYIKGKEYYIENIMVEGFLEKAYPFHITNDSIWQNYCAMATIYSIFLFVLTCYLDEDSTDEDFIYCASLVARSLFHNKEHSENLEKHLKETQSNTLAHMAMLVL